MHKPSLIRNRRIGDVGKFDEIKLPREQKFYVHGTVHLSNTSFITRKSCISLVFYKTSKSRNCLKVTSDIVEFNRSAGSASKGLSFS